MKKKKTIILIMLAVSIFFLTVPAIAFSENAKDLINNAVFLKKQGLKMEAKAAFLEAKKKIVNDLTKNPNNIDALYASALYHYYLGNHQGAYARFELVYIKSKGKKGKDIFKFYQKKSQEAMLNNNWKLSINLSVASYDFIRDSSRKKLAANEFYTLGKAWLDKDEYHVAKKYFVAAKTLDSSYASKTASAFIESADSRTIANAKLLLLRAALDLNPSFEQTITQKAGLYLKNNQIKQAQVTRELNKFPRKIVIIIVKIAWPPDYIKCDLGPSPSFILKPEEYSPYLKCQYGATRLYQSKYGKYKICFRNDKCYSPDKVPSHNRSDFRFQGITDCDVRAFFE